MPAPSWMQRAPRAAERAEPLPTHDDRIYPPEKISGRLLTTTQLNSLPPLKPLIKHFLYQDTLAMLYGPSGSGKTFLAVAWAMHIATGRWWEGHTVEPTPVLYIIAEGARGVGKRVEAWTEHNKQTLEQSEPIYWHPAAINLAERPQAEALATVAAELGVGLVVIDTLARCAVGAEENSAKDMGKLVDNCDIIRNKTKACILFVHHSGKDLSSGARGSSVLRAAMDTEISLSSDTLTVTKAKDWDPPKALNVKLTPTERSCVLVSCGAETNNVALDALREIMVPGGVSASVWRKSSQSEGMSDSTFYRARKQLVENKVVVNLGSDKATKYVISDTTS